MPGIYQEVMARYQANRMKKCKTHAIKKLVRSCHVFHVIVREGKKENVIKRCQLSIDSGPGPLYSGAMDTDSNVKKLTYLSIIMKNRPNIQENESQTSADRSA